MATQIGAPAAPDLPGRSFQSPENTAQQRTRSYRPNAAGWAPLAWSEKNRKVAISGVPVGYHLAVVWADWVRAIEACCQRPFEFARLFLEVFS